MGRKSGSPVEVRICWEVINRLEEEGCFRYHHLHHLADDDAITVWFRRSSWKDGACSRNALPSSPLQSDTVCIFIALSNMYVMHIP